MLPKRKHTQADRPTAATKRRKTAKNNSDKDAKKPTTFFSLPAELRNDIYERALIQPEVITVNRRLKEPKLLATCRQVREEARSIWYLQNKFTVVIPQCDAKLATAFLKLVKQFNVHEQDEPKREVVVFLNVRGSKKMWANVVAWCREIHRHDLPRIEATAVSKRVGSVVAAAHAITWASRGSSWEECHKALNGMRVALGVMDYGWRRDRANE